jgi:hypothetical protein
MAKKHVEVTLTEPDIQLLLRIRNSQFVKSTELCEHALRSGIAKNKSPFYARMEKLIKGGLVEVVEEHPGKYSLYAISKLGLLRLEEKQLGTASLTSESDALPRKPELPHALKLNELRNYFESVMGATGWMSSLEIAASNIEDGTFAKDYDAACWLPRDVWKKQPLRCALEFERTAKENRRYLEIGEHIRRENAVSFVLYLFDWRRMIAPIMEQIGSGRVVFTTAHALLAHGLKCPVFVWKGDKILQTHLADILATVP